MIKKTILLLFIILILTACGTADAEATSDVSISEELQVGDSNIQLTELACGCVGYMPEGICPTILVKGTLYRFHEIAYETVELEGMQTLLAEGNGKLPDGFTEYGMISSITEQIPVNDLQLQAGAGAEGAVFINDDYPAVIYLYLTDSWMDLKPCYIRFVSDALMDNQCILFNGDHYRYISGDWDGTPSIDELPKDAVLVGTLFFVGKNSVPTQDLDTNCICDAYGYGLNGREVYQGEDKSVIYLYEKRYWAGGEDESWRVCSRY